jgi:RNA 2',3'-cyclic 3'-phosphodiesterase
MSKSRQPDEVVRAFIAVEISDPVRQSLADLEAELKKTSARVGWVAPQNIHLTLVFLGEVFLGQVRKLGSALDSIAAETPVFSYEVAGAGAFGSPRSPRVLWVGVQESGTALATLQGRLAEAVRALGFHVEDRAFKPHLTLGRVRTRQGVDELTSVLQSANNTRYGSVEVCRLLLMQSHLEHQGVSYSVLHTSALKGA